MNKFKFKPLEWHDEPLNYYGVPPRTTAISDTWNELDCTDEEWEDHVNNKHGHRIYARYDVFNAMDENGAITLKCWANWREEAAVEVRSMQEGRELCEQWHQEYWTTFINDLMKNIIEN